MWFPGQRWVKAHTPQIRRSVAVARGLVWPPRASLALWREMPYTAVRHAVECVRSFCLDLEAQQKTIASESAAPAERGPAPDERGYIILAPSYRSISAGIYCMYRLCHELNRRGFRSYITGSTRTPPHLTAPLISRRKARSLCRNGFTAVYPETVFGNPLRARCVARWVLNRPGLLGGEPVFDESETVFYYTDLYLPYIRNRVAGKLYMPTIDEEIFFCDDGDLSRRSLECFYVGKSQWKDGIIDRNRAFEITRGTPPKRELGKLFRASRVLYCFDNSSILAYEALMCGCPVVIIPDGTQTKEDYQRMELGTSGIAWGLEELPGVMAEVSKLRKRYDRAKIDFRTQFDNFVAATQAAQNAHDHKQRHAA
jgi:hypothetical protein